MKYSIGEVSNKLNIPTSTLRYYEKEGLLPFVKRSDGGIRIFSDSDIEAINIIECLKDTEMPIKDIKIFMDWCVKGDSTLELRHKMFLERKEIVIAQLAKVQKTLAVIEYKCNYYTKAIEAGTEVAVKSFPCTE